MIKKIIIGLVLAGVVGVLVFGAVNRTIAKTGSTEVAQGNEESERRGQNRDGESLESSEAESFDRQGRNRQSVEETETNNLDERLYQNSKEDGSEETNRGQSSGRNGQGNQGNETRVEGLALETSQELAPGSQDWLTFEGLVSAANEEEIVILTADNQEIILSGQTYRYARELGFSVVVGDPVQIRGFEENGEIEVGEVTLLATGQSFALRSESGRPNWAGGNGRRGGQGG